MAENMTTNNRQDIKWINALIFEYGNSNNEDSKTFADRLTADRIRCRIRPMSLYHRCVDNMLANPSIKTDKYCSVLNYFLDIYEELFPCGEETSGFDELAPAFADLFADRTIPVFRCFEVKIFDLFKNKHNYLRWVKSLAGRPRITKILGYCIDYGMEARSYFADEDMFTSNYILITDKLLNDIYPEKVYEAATADVRHMVGIYDVDEGMILEAEQQLNAARDVIARSTDVLAETDKRAKLVDSLSQNAVDRVKQVCSVELETAKAQLEDISRRMNDEYDNFMKDQKDGIMIEKQQLVDEICAEARAGVETLQREARNVISMARLELAKLNRESGDVLTKLDSYMSDNTKLQEMLEAGAEREALMSKLDRIAILNDNNISALEAQVSSAAKDRTAPSCGVAAGGYIMMGRESNRQDVVPEVDEGELGSVNPLLDESVSFRTRFDAVMEAKKRREEKGEHFHRMFDDVIMAVMENSNPYLIGPSGCGKTYMVSQLASMLNLDFIDIGYINEEYDILGFQTANGGYSKPNFYRCYKYGKIAFCDELDNGNSRATVKLNSFLSNSHVACYSFPNGENVKRHANFRIIAAGNTAGNGADSVYNTREKIEESVQQRFTPIYIGYDNEVEKAILGDANDWYEFAVLFRNATDAWSRKSHSAAPGIFTTRDAARIRRYLDNDSFTRDKILDYEFIQTKDENYLAYLATYISEKMANDSPAKEIVEEFARKVKDIREGRIVRQ